MGWLLADDGYYGEPSGRTYTMAQDVAATEASYKQKPESATIVKFLMIDINIRMYKDVALVTVMGRPIATKNGVERLGNAFRAVHVWEKRDGHWKLAVDQVTGVTN